MTHFVPNERNDPQEDEEYVKSKIEVTDVFFEGRHRVCFIVTIRKKKIANRLYFIDKINVHVKWIH